MTTNDKRRSIFAEIDAERERQDAKRGEQNHPMTGAQRAAVQRDALRSALPGERVAEELAALRALITKGGAL